MSFMRLGYNEIMASDLDSYNFSKFYLDRLYNWMKWCARNDKNTFCQMTWIRISHVTCRIPFDAWITWISVYTRDSFLATLTLFLWQRAEPAERTNWNRRGKKKQHKHTHCFQSTVKKVRWKMGERRKLKNYLNAIDSAEN